MLPYVIEIGNFRIPGYGLSIGIGMLLGILLGVKRANKRLEKLRHEGVSDDILSRYPNGDEIFDMAIILAIMGFLGAKIFFIIQNLSLLKTGISLMSLIRSGFVVYAGLITGAITGVVLCKIKKKSFFASFDIMTPSIALIQGFGRMGCLMAGCCYGKQTKLPIGIQFHNHLSLAPRNVNLFPTQIVSSMYDFLLCIVLIIISRKTRKDGLVSISYLFIYSVGRFFIEYFRGDEVRGSLGIFSTSQIISIITIICGIAIYLLFIRKKVK